MNSRITKENIYLLIIFLGTLLLYIANAIELTLPIIMASAFAASIVTTLSYITISIFKSLFK